MKVGVGVGGEVVVDGQVDTFDIDAAAKDIGGNADTLVEFFEFFVALDTSRGVSRVSKLSGGDAYRSS